MGKAGGAGTGGLALLLLTLYLASAPLHCSAAFNRKQKQQQQQFPPAAAKEWSPPPPSSLRLPEPPSIDVERRSSAVFPLYGNVYPDGLYFVSLSIGDPPRPYFLDVDTGSDLTWVQCDAPCVSCSKSPLGWNRDGTLGWTGVGDAGTAPAVQAVEGEARPLRAPHLRLPPGRHPQPLPRRPAPLRVPQRPVRLRGGVRRPRLLSRRPRQRRLLRPPPQRLRPPPSLRLRLRVRPATVRVGRADADGRGAGAGRGRVQLHVPAAGAGTDAERNGALPQQEGRWVPLLRRRPRPPQRRHLDPYVPPRATQVLLAWPCESLLRQATGGQGLRGDLRQRQLLHVLCFQALRDLPPHDDEGPLGEALEGGTRRPHPAILLEGCEAVQVHRRRAEVLQAPDAQLPPGEQSSPGHPPRRLPRPHKTRQPVLGGPQRHRGGAKGPQHHWRHIRAGPGGGLRQREGADRMGPRQLRQAPQVVRVASKRQASASPSSPPSEASSRSSARPASAPSG